jgi:TIR domain
MPTVTTTPLRILICHAGSSDSWGARTAASLDLGLFGDPSKDREKRWEPLDLAAAIPLEIEADTFGAPPPGNVGDYLNAVLHTVVVALVDDDFLADRAWMDWLDQCLKHSGTEQERHCILPVVSQQTRGSFPAVWLQSLAEQDLGEEAERVELLALRVLQTAIDTLTRGRGERADRKLRLFVSHAKRDGLPLARSLNALLERNRGWLDRFYDAEDIKAGRSWKQQLEEAVASSVLLALRTDNYDHRTYCKAEVLWAEEHCAPMVFVDARGGLVHAASSLPFESGPCVRIPDGNLIRVLHAALRVTLRSEAFRRQVAELQATGLLPTSPSLQVIPVIPGMSAIARACEILKLAPATPTRTICYPDPKLAKGSLEAAAALAATVGAQLVTPQELLAAPGATTP